MSKWYKVEITSKQMGEIWKKWPRYGKNANLQGRMKVRPYRTVVDIDGKTKTKPIRFGETTPAKEITYLFKFKNPDEAMAFKLEWS